MPQASLHPFGRRVCVSMFVSVALASGRRPYVHPSHIYLCFLAGVKALSLCGLDCRDLALLSYPEQHRSHERTMRPTRAQNNRGTPLTSILLYLLHRKVDLFKRPNLMKVSHLGTGQPSDINHTRTDGTVSIGTLAHVFHNATLGALSAPIL
ncbi:hypothetical protein B0H21DRAFT_77030 [Amylocystis lapponica]|nr:hypothetical protein B0H21DRAFT_77030 [Amylocystis lapponica]